MSVVPDSYEHYSSGSDDFIDYLNEDLDASSPNSLLDEEAENQDARDKNGLRLHDEEISRLRNREMKKFLYSKKLFLVLDLDHTLPNTTILGQLSSEELHLLNETDSLEDVSKGSLFKLEHMHMMTKLRPFVRTFLKEASEMFEMYIYTMGDRPYALEMTKLLDPQVEYFDAKVISRDDIAASEGS
ncbi:RNA polymerase II C-terminal domain phosphatase [Trifolium repens]|nr:RNA polymerase II C-terminal domain phosphatase [Trifolium repens]